MALVKSYVNWNTRKGDEEPQVEPYRKYFFICEGANTETWYFMKLIDIKKVLDLNPIIDIRLLEKTEEDKDISFPKNLINFAETQKDNSELSFDRERDKMIVVFDADVFETRVDGYDDLIASNTTDNILAISNPSFELFLLLHCAGSYEEDIVPNEDKIIENKKIGKQRFIRKLFTERTGINPKTNPKVGELARQIDIAILQEKKINQNICDATGKVTCNIGSIIESIRNDNGD